MKKLLGVVVLGSLLVILNSCDDRGTKFRKNHCTKFVEKNSVEFKDCIKSADHAFVYGLEEAIQREKADIDEFNKKVNIVNATTLDVSHKDYEEVDFQKFLRDNFNDQIILEYKNKDVLKKKIKFKSGFYIGLGEEEDLTLNKQDPNDYYNALWFVNSNYYSVEIKSKILSPQKQGLFWMTKSGEIESQIYGMFYQSPDNFGKESKFLIQDIKMYPAQFNRTKTINKLVEQHANTSGSDKDPDQPSVNEVRSNVKRLMEDILK